MACATAMSPRATALEAGYPSQSAIASPSATAVLKTVPCFGGDERQDVSRLRARLGSSTDACFSNSSLLGPSLPSIKATDSGFLCGLASAAACGLLPRSKASLSIPMSCFRLRRHQASLCRRGSSGSSEEIVDDISVRSATAADMPWIALTLASLVMSPFGLDWQNFVVAEQTSEASQSGDPARLGFAQLRSLEDSSGGPWLLASLVVLPTARGRGLGSRLVRWLLGQRAHRGRRRVFALTLANKLGFFAPLGFRQLTTSEESDLPSALSLEASLGRIIAPLVAGEELIVLQLDEALKK
ncbi:unnamed protein product [Polarella glacialis]|uniref:N-acetyltransferase domain-containing protein n=1 Tax=Polarella glacialis TaxID=89957 RepID=A0A813LPM6_POLGL|nr:unnamed protein product [Polarella glacialis]